MQHLRKLHIADYMYVFCYWYWHPVLSTGNYYYVICDTRRLHVQSAIAILNAICEGSRISMHMKAKFTTFDQALAGKTVQT